MKRITTGILVVLLIAAFAAPALSATLSLDLYNAAGVTKCGKVTVLGGDLYITLDPTIAGCNPMPSGFAVVLGVYDPPSNYAVLGTVQDVNLNGKIDAAEGTMHGAIPAGFAFAIRYLLLVEGSTPLTASWISGFQK